MNNKLSAKSFRWTKSADTILVNVDLARIRAFLIDKITWKTRNKDGVAK